MKLRRIGGIADRSSGEARQQSYARSIAFLVAATAGTQLLVVASSPLLTRLYTPADFGTWGSYSAALALFVSAATLRLEAAIPIAVDEAAAGSIARLALAVLCLTTAVVTAIAVIWGEGVLALAGLSSLTPVLWLFPVGCFLTGIFQVQSMIIVRSRRFGALGRAKGAQAVGQVGGQLGAGAAALGPLGLVAGDVIGRAGAVAMMLPDLRRGVAGGSRAGMWSAGRRYARFPLIAMPASVLTTAGTYVPFLLIAAYFGSAALGSYNLAFRVLGLPAMLLGQATSQVFLARATRHPDQSLGATYERLTIGLFALGAPVFAVMAATGRQVFTIVFGPAWTEAGSVVQVLAPWFLLWLVASPVSSLVLARERQAGALLLTIVNLSLTVLSVVLAHSVRADVIQAAALLSASGVVVNIIGLAYTCRLADASFSRMVRAFAVVLTIAAVAAVGSASVIDLLEPPYNLLIPVVFAFAAYAVIFVVSAPIRALTYWLRSSDTAAANAIPDPIVTLDV